MANEAEDLSRREADAERKETTEPAVEREMTADEAEREFEEMRDRMTQEAKGRAKNFDTETDTAVEKAEAKAGEPMSPDEKAALARIDERVKKATQELIGGTGESSAESPVSKAASDVLRTWTENVNGEMKGYLDAIADKASDDRTGLLQLRHDLQRQANDFFAVSPSGVGLLSEDLKRKMSKEQLSVLKEQMDGVFDAVMAKVNEAIAARARGETYSTPELTAPAYEGPTDTEVTDAQQTEEAPSTGPAATDLRTQPMSAAEEAATIEASRPPAGTRTEDRVTQPMSDAEVEATVAASSFEKARLDAEAANAALSPEDLAARQREFEQAVREEATPADLKADAEQAKADLQEITDEDVEKAVDAVTTDEEKARKDLEDLTDEEIEAAISGLENTDGKEVRSDLASVTEQELDAMLDRFIVEHTTEGATQDLRNMTDTDIEAAVERLTEDGAKEGKGGELMEMAAALAALEGLRSTEAVAKRLIEKRDERLKALEDAKETGDGEAKDKRDGAERQLSPYATPGSSRKNATQKSNGKFEKKPPLSQRLGKWFDDTFIKPGALTRLYKKISSLWKP